jgi:hypothetical protein
MNSQETVSKSAWRPCNAVVALESGVGDSSPLPSRYCRNETAPVTDECPSAGRIAVVVDHDNETAAQHTWRSLIEDVNAAGVECATVMHDPLRGRLPGLCDTIQHLSSGMQMRSCRTGANVFPQGTPPEGNTTPAANAVRNLCRRISSREIDVALLAFDGVPDANPTAQTPAQEFAEAVGDCAAKDLVISVVAAPERYRYLYVFGGVRFRDYSDRMTKIMAQRWNGSGVLAEALLLTPRWDARQNTAAVRFDAGSHLREVQWDTAGPDVERVTSRGATVGYRIDAQRWTSSTESKGKAYRMQWNADPKDWEATASVGLITKPPLVYGNRMPPEDSAVLIAVGTPYQQLLNCDSTRIPGADSARCADLPATAHNFYQRLEVTPNAFELALFTGDQLSWLGSDAPMREYTSLVRASRGAAASSLALVAPLPDVDPCMASLASAIRNVHRWHVIDTTAEMLRRGAVSQQCTGSRLQSLGNLFAQTVPKHFATKSGTFADTADRRVGMESLMAAIAEVTRVERAKASASACVLCTIRVTFESCEPPKMVELKR